MSYLEELLPEFRKGAKIRCSDWIDGIYIQKDGESIVNHNNYTANIHAEDALSNRWELYQENIDWNYIIKNKCLCWFWDDCFEAANIGLLGDIYKECDLKYVLIDEDGNRGQYLNCRPVRKDEVTFYEDKKDVL